MLDKMIGHRVTGTFGLSVPGKHKYWLKLERGVIRDCSPDLREVYKDVHVSYLLKFLENKYGEVLSLYEV